VETCEQPTDDDIVAAAKLGSAAPSDVEKEYRYVHCIPEEGSDV